MVNFGINAMSLLGLLDILGSIAYLILAIAQISKGVYNSTSTVNTALQLLELLGSPLALFLGGIILLFNGWRLDPILQFQQFLFHVVVGLSFTKMTVQLANSNR